MTVQVDQRNQPYVDVDNIRITFVPATVRDPDKRWEATDMLRFNAYRDDGTSAIHRGAEIPLPSAERLVELIAAMCAVYAVGRGRTDG